MPYPRLRPRESDLPVAQQFDQIVAAVVDGSLVLTAAPGAGKSSLVPFAVDAALGSDSQDPQRVLLLEPRRMAASATASRLAELLGEKLGDSVGLTMRGRRLVGPNCRIEVMTEAVLTRRIQHDPELLGIGAIIFDEFHERNLHTDLGLAMAIEARDSIRPKLKLIVMSATMSSERVAALLGGATVVEVPGRAFPVATEHRGRPASREWPRSVAVAATEAAGRVKGDVLVFVPGRREITQVCQLLDHHPEVIGLHGGAGADALQRGVLAPSLTSRIIVATSVAETSVTIPGVEAVVDGGLARRARFDAATGLGRLETGFVSRFAADQRRGRAGRTGPGLCIRLWSQDDHALLNTAVPPEILEGDPLLVAMELLRWGDPTAATLPLLDRPPRHRLEAANQILQWLGLANQEGKLTKSGEAAATLPTHPRLAALLLLARRAGRLDEALAVAAALDGDHHPPGDALAEFVTKQRGRHEAKETTKRLRRALDAQPAVGGAQKLDIPAGIGPLLAAAWPDRIALPRPGRPNDLLLATGREVAFAGNTSVGGEADAYIIADATVSGDSGRVRLAESFDRRLIARLAANHIESRDLVHWDDRLDTVTAQRQTMLGAIVLHNAPLAKPSRSALHAAFRSGLRRRGLDLLGWTSADQELRGRLAWLNGEAPQDWPDVSDQALLETVEQWLPLDSVNTPTQLRSLRPGPSLLNLLDWKQKQRLDELAPASLSPPNGRAKPIHYQSGRPVWKVRIQHVLGLDKHPLIGPSQTPLTIELLSPANRPAQTTTDLPGFWRGSYKSVRTELRGRYPKHDWPEDPTIAGPPGAGKPGS